MSGPSPHLRRLSIWLPRAQRICLATPVRRHFLLLIVFSALGLVSAGQFRFVWAEPSDGAQTERTEDEQRARRLKQMKRAAELYRLRRDDESGEPLMPVREPILKWSNLEKASNGTVFIWTDRGRPEAMIQFYAYENPHLSHECQSLSLGKLWAQKDRAVVWKPHQDKEVWSVPRYDWKRDPSQPFLVLWKLPAPEI